jgi:tetratricopeptide (TPR) repeat protein
VRWLEKACLASQTDISRYEKILSNFARGETAETLSQLEIFHEAELIYGDLVDRGNTDLKLDYADLLKGCSHQYESCNDHGKALELLERANRLYHEQWDDRHEIHVLIRIAIACLLKIQIMQNIGKSRVTLTENLALIDLLEKHQADSSNQEIKEYLGKAYITIGNTCYLVSDCNQAMQFQSKAIECFQTLSCDEKIDAYRERLAVSYHSLAMTLNRMGDIEGSVKSSLKSIEIKTQLAQAEQSDAFMRDFAYTLMNYAITQHDLKNYSISIQYYDQAIAILEALVLNRNRTQFAEDLAFVYTNKAGTLLVNNDFDEQFMLTDKSIGLIRDLITRSGRIELLNLLATNYYTKSSTLLCLNRLAEAKDYMEKSIEIRTILITRLNQQDLRGDLAWSQVYKAMIDLKIEPGSEKAKRELFQAFETLTAEIERTGRFDLVNAKKNLISEVEILFPDLHDQLRQEGLLDDQGNLKR